jgi:hypothetical protein
LPVSLATWEDLEYLKQQFPHANVWSHPSAQGGGNVMASPATSVTVPDLAIIEAKDGPVLRRSSRPRAPSTRVTGSQWATA